MAWLVIKTPQGEQRCALGPTTILGRHPESTIQILDPRASKRHCMIYQRGEEIWVRDFDSANGTLVNGVRIQGEVKLKAEDRILIGSAIFRLVDRPPEGDAPPAAVRVVPAPAPPPLIAAPHRPDGAGTPAAAAIEQDQSPLPENGLLILDRSGHVRVRLWNVRVNRGGFFLRIPLAEDRPPSSRLHYYVGRGSQEQLLFEKDDAAFEELLETARRECGPLPEYLRVRSLNDLVYRTLGGHLTRALHERCSGFCAAHAGSPIRIGELINLGVGFCRHRAFLFFHLARRLGLRVELYRGVVPGGRHAWNEVSVNGERVFVDPTLGVVLDDAFEAERAYGYQASRLDVPRLDENQQQRFALVLGDGDADRVKLPAFRHELRKVPGDEEAVLLLYPDSDLPEVRFLHVDFHVGSSAVAMFSLPSLASARVFSIVGDEAHYLLDALDRSPRAHMP